MAALLDTWLPDALTPRALDEAVLRRAVDRAVGRALIEPTYRARLLAEPTIVVEGVGCSPRQYLALRGIEAGSIEHFARQAASLFWPSAAVRGWGFDAAPAAIAGSA